MNARIIENARAKPLNVNTLAVLPYGIEVWNDQIQYLTDALSSNTLPALEASFKKKRDDLILARDWLQSKIDVERRGGES